MNDSKQLDRSLNPINVLAIALGSIIGWGAFVMPGETFLKSSGPLGTAIGMAIGGFIMIIIAYCYGYMIQKIPVAGGAYAFSFKEFGHKHAFVCGWFLGLSYLSIVPLNATALGMIGRYMFPGILQKGYLYSVAGWEVYLGEIIFSAIALIIFAVISIKGAKISGNVQTIMALFLVGSIIILMLVAIFSDKTSINNLKPLFSPDVPPISGILSIVAIAPWAYVGFDSIPQAVEEFKFSSKGAFRLMIISIVFGGIMYIAMNTITAIVYPWNEFISSNPFWATGDSIKQLMGNIGIMILGIALLSATLTGICGFYMTTSRLLFSMSRTKALPSWFGIIHPKYKTPINAIKFVLIVSLIAPWFGRQVLSWIVDMASIGTAIGYFYTAVSTFKSVRKRRENMHLKIFSIVASILSLGFVALLIVPGMPSYLALPSRIALIVWIILGFAFYTRSRSSYSNLTNDEIEKLIFNEE